MYSVGRSVQVRKVYTMGLTVHRAAEHPQWVAASRPRGSHSLYLGPMRLCGSTGLHCFKWPRLRIPKSRFPNGTRTEPRTEPWSLNPNRIPEILDGTFGDRLLRTVQEGGLELMTYRTNVRCETGCFV